MEALTFPESGTLVAVTILVAVVQTVTALQFSAYVAAVQTGRVATSLTLGKIVFLSTRFLTMLSLPLLGNYADLAAKGQFQEADLISQVRFVMVGNVVGCTLALLLLPSAVAIFRPGVESVHKRGVPGAVLNALKPSVLIKCFSYLRRPGRLGAKLSAIKDIPLSFLLSGVVATGVVAIGSPSVALVSALDPERRQTAVLLTGFINFTAILVYSIWTEPQAALITDRIRSGTRPAQDIHSAAFFLVAANLVGALCSLFMLQPAVDILAVVTRGLGSLVLESSVLVIWLCLFSGAMVFLQSTIFGSQVSAVRTSHVATSFAIFGFFGLLYRVGLQAYSPFLGLLSDNMAGDPTAAAELEKAFRYLLGSAAIGSVIGLLSLATMSRALVRLNEVTREQNSLLRAILRGFDPRGWGQVWGFLAAPWSLRLSKESLSRLPLYLLALNMIATAFLALGQLAAIYSGAVLVPNLARTATLLSPVVNAAGTMILALLIEPTTSRLIDATVKGDRDAADLETWSFGLALTATTGFLLSQLMFVPAAQLVSAAAVWLDRFAKML